MNVQEITWPTYHYALVVGIWALCYLCDSDVKDLLSKVAVSLKKEGNVVFVEPILDPNESKPRL